jgi:hypothetical protein
MNQKSSGSKRSKSNSNSIFMFLNIKLDGHTIFACLIVELLYNLKYVNFHNLDANYDE